MPAATWKANRGQISPAVTQAKTYAKSDDLLEAAVKENVHQSAKDLLANSEILRDASERPARLTVIEAEYQPMAVPWLVFNSPASGQNSQSSGKENSAQEIRLTES